MSRIWNFLHEQPQGIFIFFYCLILTAFCSLSFGQYHCDWNVFDAGGGFLNSTDFQTNTSLSQPAIGYLTTTNFQAFIGFWQVGPLVGIEESEEMPNLIKLETKLFNPQPNPFTYKTRIIFSLKNQTNVKLFIYDLTGRVVKNLINGNMKPGVYSIDWRGDDNQSKKLGKGIYFLKFEAEGYQKIKKLLPVR